MLVWPNKCFYFFAKIKYACVINSCVISQITTYCKNGVHARDRHFTQIWYEKLFKRGIKLMISQHLYKSFSLLRNT